MRSLVKFLLGVQLPSVLAVAIVLSLLTGDAEAGATLNLTYKGQIEGLEATATVSFEDVRTVVSGGGFLLVGGRPAWARVYALTGRIYLGAEIRTPTAGYALNGTVESTSDWGFADAVTLDSSERFLVRLDFQSDANFTYLDAFALTPNPLDPPQTSYFFRLDVPPSPVAELKLTRIYFSKGRPTIEWQATPGHTYRLLSKDSLEALAWTLVDKIVANSDTAALEDDGTAGVPRRFYHVERVD